MIDIQGKSPKLLVIGDLMIDHYLWGSCKKISPEAPVQVINVDRESTVLGGAGNVINNLKTLGANVDIISVLGDCSVASELLDLLGHIKVETKYLITQPGRITSKKSRIIASQQQVVRYDRESTDEINIKSQNLILSTFKKIIKLYDAILLSDYGKGVLTDNLTQSLIKVAKKYSKKVLIDPKGSNYSKYKGAYLLTPNKNEASEATQININNDENLSQAIIKLKSEYELDVALITLSEQGVAIYENELRIHPTTTKEVFDVTGAGDTVLASLGFSLALGFDIDESVEFSNLAAGIVVGKIGSATTTVNEVIEYESSLNKSASDMHIKTLDEIIVLASELKARGKKNCFY